MRGRVAGNKALLAIVADGFFGVAIVIIKGIQRIHAALGTACHDDGLRVDIVTRMHLILVDGRGVDHNVHVLYRNVGIPLGNIACGGSKIVRRREATDEK